MGAPPPEGRGSPLRLRWAVLRFHCAPGPSQDPLTRAHVRLLGPCFKTGRVGDRPTHCQPPVPRGSDAANGAPRRDAHSIECDAPKRGSLATLCPATLGGDEESPKGLATPRSGDGPLHGWLTTDNPHEASRRPPAGSVPSGRRACTARPVAVSFGRETNASERAEGALPDGPGLGKPCSVFRTGVRADRLNPLATGFRGPTRLPLSSFTYS